MKLEKELSDTLAELVGLGMGRAAEVLNAMLDSHIALSVPTLRLVDIEELVSLFAQNASASLSAVQMRYAGSMRGTVELIFTSGEAGRLVDCLMGETTVLEEGLDAIRAGTLCEIGNIVINALLGTLANQLGMHLEYTVPAYLEGAPTRLFAEADLSGQEMVLLAETDFRVESRSIHGKIAIFFSLDSFQVLRDAIETYAAEPA